MRGKFLLSVLLVGALAVACNSTTGSFGDDDDDYGYASSSSSSGGKRKTSSSSGYDDGSYNPFGTSSSSSGYYPPYLDGGMASSSSSSGWSDVGMPQPLDKDIVAFKISFDACMRPADSCADAQAFTVDLVKSTLATTTCLELSGGGTQDATTSRAMTPSEIAKIKTLLSQVLVTKYYGVADGGPGAYGGNQKTLKVTTKTSDNLYYTPDGMCSPQGSVATYGWQPLYDALRSM